MPFFDYCTPRFDVDDVPMVARATREGRKLASAGGGKTPNAAAPFGRGEAQQLRSNAGDTDDGLDDEDYIRLPAAAYNGVKKTPTPKKVLPRSGCTRRSERRAVWVPR